MTTPTGSGPAAKAEYVLGLDLGQASDFTAMAVAEKTLGARGLSHYALRHLKRWPLQTPYTGIVADVAALLARPPLAGAVLAVDQTGVGAPVVDMFRAAQTGADLQPVLITGGHEVTRDEEYVWHVPKKELVSTMQVLAQGRRLRCAAVPERQLLLNELAAFRVKVTVAGNESFEALRQRDHDDLVLALALACWVGERSLWWGPDACTTGGGSLVAKMFRATGMGGPRRDHETDYDAGPFDPDGDDLNAGGRHWSDSF